MAASEQFSLCWDNFLKNMSSGMNSLLESEDLVDVTLAVQGKHLKAHKMVLSVCSPYFKELFKSNPCQHPIVFMKDVSYEALKDLLTFMYQGEVQVSQENLTTFIKTAEALQIKGLTGDGNGTSETEVQEVTDKPRVEEYKHISRPKKQSTTISSAPQAKRSRLSVSSNESQPSSAIPSKSEPLTSPTESSQFKVEPYEQAQSLQDDLGEENFGDDTMDENTVDDGEDYSMMESGHGDEPQASTSTDGTGEGQGAKRKRSHHQRKTVGANPAPSKSKSDYCMECLDYYYTTKSKRDWVQCVKCENWMHDNCTMYGHLCNACGRLNRRDLLKKTRNK